MKTPSWFWPAVAMVLVIGGAYMVWAQGADMQGARAPAANLYKPAGQGYQAPLNSTSDNKQPAVQVQVLSLTAQKSGFPILKYRVDGNVEGNGYISIVSKGSGAIVWGMEQEPSGTHSIDLTTLSAINGSSVKLAEGNYFLRVQDRSGNVLADSVSFQVKSAPKPAPTPTIVADVDGDSFISLVYSNLPLSKVVLVRASSGEEFDVDDNVQGSGGAEFTETNKPAGTYYLKVVAHGTGAEVARTTPFYLNTRP